MAALARITLGTTFLGSSSAIGRFLGLVWLASLLSVGGCNTTGAPAAPTSPAATVKCTTLGSFNAQIDGAPWVADCASGIYETLLGRVTVSATTVVDATNFTLYIVASTPGTYVVGGPVPTAFPSSGAELDTHCPSHGACITWYVSGCCGQPDGNGSGTITIDRFTTSEASGTFALNMVPNSATSARGVKVVTGTFDVALSVISPAGS